MKRKERAKSTKDFNIFAIYLQMYNRSNFFSNKSYKVNKSADAIYYTCAGLRRPLKALNNFIPSLLPLFGFAITKIGFHILNFGFCTCFITTLLRPK